MSSPQHKKANGRMNITAQGSRRGSTKTVGRHSAAKSVYQASTRQTKPSSAQTNPRQPHSAHTNSSQPHTAQSRRHGSGGVPKASQVSNSRGKAGIHSGRHKAVNQLKHPAVSTTQGVNPFYQGQLSLAIKPITVSQPSAGDQTTRRAVPSHKAMPLHKAVKPAKQANPAKPSKTPCHKAVKAAQSPLTPLLETFRRAKQWTLQQLQPIFIKVGSFGLSGMSVSVSGSSEGLSRRELRLVRATGRKRVFALAAIGLAAVASFGIGGHYWNGDPASTNFKYSTVAPWEGNFAASRSESREDLNATADSSVATPTNVGQDDYPYVEVRVFTPLETNTAAREDSGWSLGESNKVSTDKLTTKKEEKKADQDKSNKANNAAQQADKDEPSPTQEQPDNADTTPPSPIEIIPSVQVNMAEHPAPASTGDSGNGYPWGQCTWYAYERRHQLGLPIGSFFGNGWMWVNSARSHGYSVDNNPKVGDVVVFMPGQAWADPYYGHVAVVESVNADNTITISESNARGLGVISSRVLSNPNFFTYIH